MGGKCYAKVRYLLVYRVLGITNITDKWRLKLSSNFTDRIKCLEIITDN